MSARTIKRVSLGAKHTPSGQTTHRLGAHPAPTPTNLAIVAFADDPGFYLLYLDANGAEITDTYHSTIESALDQAKWEYNVEPDDWSDVT